MSLLPDNNDSDDDEGFAVIDFIFFKKKALQAYTKDAETKFQILNLTSEYETVVKAGSKRETLFWIP